MATQDAPALETITASTFSRAAERPEEAVLPRPVVETSGLQPEDVGALAYLLLLGPDVHQTGKDLAVGMRALGWKMSDDRFEKIAKRLTAAGHLLRESRYDPATKLPKWHYSVYRNPANNPRYVAEGTVTLSQVSDGTRENRVPEDGHPSGTRENRVPPGQSRKPGKPGSGAEPAKTGFPSEGVFAGQSRKPEKPGSGSPPPHPPEEVTTSSPYPLTDPSGALPSQRGEEEASAFSEELLTEARSFLGELPYPWTVGRQAARRIAPQLLDVVNEQGWTLNDDLVAELTKNPDGVRNHVRTLEKVRIPNLIPRRMVPAKQAAPRTAGPDDRQPATKAEIEALRNKVMKGAMEL
ncbi:hypothetical protein [Streptomyces sp. NPDC058297]|uniref:hypothetical protein n=1 Tax=Streptomyces sp. NPDC058297 TaxID=3346433 RepID=UPI0036E58535